MKTIKISLSFIVVAAILFFVFRSLTPTEKVGEIQHSGNPSIDNILQEISILKLKPENVFCKDFYDIITYHIDDYHRNGRFGKTTPENDQWKVNLTNQLYAAYADKFIKQAYYIFNGPVWAGNDLNFIRNEYQRLQNSTILERNSLYDKKLNEIKAIFNKYDEIISFISACKVFSDFDTSIDHQFPLNEVNDKIVRANSYRNRQLENSTLNNCIRLHNELKEIPKYLLNAHVQYLDLKINKYTGYFEDYNSQKSYSENVWRPIKNEVEALNNEIYNPADFYTEYNRLNQKWDTEGADAYKKLSR